MKRLSYLIILSIFISCSDEETINYYRDAEEVFDTDERLKELEGVSTFIGDLKIRGNVTSLESLRLLNSIQGTLFIQVARDLETLEGLNNLRHVEAIEIFYNESLTNINALSGVSTTELFKLKTLPALTSLDGMGNLYVDGSIMITNVPQLTEIGENIQINKENVYKIFISTMDNLERVNFIEGVTEAETIWINDNPKLELNGVLDGVTSVSTLHIENNDLLTALDISELNHVEFFRIEGNKNITAVDVDGTEPMDFLSFESLETSIMDNPKLETFNGLNNVPKAEIRVYGNEKLTSFTGFSSLEEVDIMVRRNPLLNTIDLFSNNELSVSRLHFFQNSALNNFCGLNQALTTDFSNAVVLFEENGFNPTIEMLNSGTCSPD